MEISLILKAAQYFLEIPYHAALNAIEFTKQDAENFLRDCGLGEDTTDLVNSQQWEVDGIYSKLSGEVDMCPESTGG